MSLELDVTGTQPLLVLHTRTVRLRGTGTVCTSTVRTILNKQSWGQKVNFEVDQTDLFRFFLQGSMKFHVPVPSIVVPSYVFIGLLGSQERERETTRVIRNLLHSFTQKDKLEV
jgi:hypothetical protein